VRWGCWFLEKAAYRARATLAENHLYPHRLQTFAGTSSMKAGKPFGCSKSTLVVFSSNGPPQCEQIILPFLSFIILPPSKRHVSNFLENYFTLWKSLSLSEAKEWKDGSEHSQSSILPSVQVSCSQSQRVSRGF